MSEPEESPQKSASHDVGMFGAHEERKEKRNWTPLIVGFALMLAIVAAIVILGRSKPEAVKTADPYAANLVVEQAKLSQAANFVGATVTYIDLTVHNVGTGDNARTVVGGTVRAVFRDTLGQAVQTETLPLRALVPHSLGGEDEAGDLALAPLGPGQTRVLRLTVEHISSEWNQAQPELEFRGLRFK